MANIQAIYTLYTWPGIYLVIVPVHYNQSIIMIYVLHGLSKQCTLFMMMMYGVHCTHIVHTLNQRTINVLFIDTDEDKKTILTWTTWMSNCIRWIVFVLVYFQKVVYILHKQSKRSHIKKRVFSFSTFLELFRTFFFIIIILDAVLETCFVHFSWTF